MPADPYAFWLTHIAQMWAAYSFALQAMVTIPTPIFCESPDPCSCTGGGFELYEPICAAAAAAREAIKTNTTNSTNTTLKINNINITQVQNEYVSLFDFLGNDTTTVLVSVGVVVIIGVTFALVRLLTGLRKAKEQKKALEVEKEKNDRIKKRTAEENKKLLQKLAEKTSALNKELTSKEIMYDEIEFAEGEDAILGAGSFGMVRRGTYHGEAVAIKQLKVAGGASGRGIFKGLFGPSDTDIDKFVEEIKIMSP